MDSAASAQLQNSLVSLRQDELNELNRAVSQNNIEDGSGWTPLALALYHGDKAVAALLRAQAGSVANGGDNGGEVRGLDGFLPPPFSSTSSTSASTITPSPYSRFHAPLKAGEWQLHVTLGALATVPGTAPTAALTLFDEQGVMWKKVGEREGGEKPRDQDIRATIQVQAESGAKEKYTAGLSLHAAAGQNSSATRWQTSVKGGGHGKEKDGEALTLHLHLPSPATSTTTTAEGGEAPSSLSPLRMTGETMVFTGRNVSDFDLRFSVSSTTAAAPTPTTDARAVEKGERESGTAGSTAAPLGEVLVPSFLMTGATSTAAVNPTSAGIENTGAASASASASAAAPSPSPARLAGQLILPVLSSHTNGFATVIGQLSLRYLFVRGWTPPGAANSSSSSGSNPDTISASSAAAVSDSPLHRSYWQRTRIVGHRGSGADCNAVVADEVVGAEEGGDASAPAAADSSSFSSSSSSSSTSLSSLSSSSFSSAASVTSDSGGKQHRQRRRTHVSENTLLSMTAAAAAGAEFCEFDVQLTRDGVPIIHHDWCVAVPLPAGAAGDGDNDDSSTTPAASLRVPVTHLTASQIRSLTPLAMVAGSVTDEYQAARTADAADASFKASSAVSVGGRLPPTHRGRGRATGRGGGGGGGGGAVPSSSASDPGNSSFLHQQRAVPAQGVVQRLKESGRTAPGLITSSSSASGGAASLVSPTLSTTSASSTCSSPPSFSPLPSPPLSSPGSTRASTENNRTLKALGIDASPSSASRLGSSFSFGLRDGFATLAEAFSKVPQTCGFNIEVKYATTAECHLFGLRQAERNAFVDRILDVVFASSSSASASNALPLPLPLRPILFSTFDPDVALLLARKQATHPVFFLTEAGTPSEPNADPRMNSLSAAVSFAREAGLAGVVSHCGPILEAPRIVREVQIEQGLTLATYGGQNNDVKNVAKQIAWGVGAVIVDHVAHVIRGTRGKGAARALDAAAAVTAAAAEAVGGGKE